MAQHDYVIANGTGAAVRSDLNNALAAIVSQNSGATEPATMYAYQWWADTTTGLLKLRNGANNAWITLRELDGTLTIEDGTAGAPGLAFADDLNTGVFSPGADQVAFTAGGTARLTATTTGITSALPVDVPLGSASAPTVTFTGDLNTGIYSPGADQVAVATNGTGRLFVDSSGKILFGTSTARSDFFNTTTFNPRVQIEGTDSNGSMFSITHNATTGNPNLILARSRGTTLGSATVVSDGDSLGIIQFQGADGTDLVVGAQISANVDGTPGANDMPGRIVLSTTADGASSPTERVRITSAGRVGIGTTSPGGKLDVKGDASSNNIIYLTNGNTGNYANVIQARDASGTLNANISFSSFDNSIVFIQGTSSERARIDSSGRLLVGTSTARDKYFASTIAPAFQVEGSTTATSAISAIRNSADDNQSYLILAKSRSSSYGVVSSGDAIGEISFQAADGTNFLQAARITAAVDGTPGANDMPGRLVFSTTADGASSPTERMRISQFGVIMFGTTNSDPGGGNVVGSSIYPTGVLQVTRDGGESAIFNRKSNDGTIVELRQDGTVEGTISVSGTTVSYNGAHLSRWSQLPSGAERIEILRGSVLSNLNEMCEWGEEDNEQLNRMKVSDVEGDKNVSGVFQCWDDDDDTYTNDFYCAMTGDFIIRIAEGVTVERGDLLMSAGDGTAKPQDDDIIRSKTIAKVTSTNVSCTYDDGSYCVPCVLMAC